MKQHIVQCERRGYFLKTWIPDGSRIKTSRRSFGARRRTKARRSPICNTPISLRSHFN